MAKRLRRLNQDQRRGEQEWADAYYWRIAAYFSLGEEGPAIQDLDEALELAPNHAYAYLLRAYAYEETDELALALQDYEQYIELPYALHRAEIMRLVEELKDDLAAQDD